MALSELQAAAQDNPRLPFVHFSLGLTYLKKQNYEQARDEFLKDAAVEPDLALNYDELGDVYSLMQQRWRCGQKLSQEALGAIRDCRIRTLGWPRFISSRRNMRGL